jgi:hypothetical protein
MAKDPFQIPPPLAGDEPDPWRSLREAESWTNGIVLQFAPSSTVSQVSDFLDRDPSQDPDLPLARCGTDFEQRTIQVTFPSSASASDAEVWSTFLLRTGLFLPPEAN